MTALLSWQVVEAKALEVRRVEGSLRRPALRHGAGRFMRPNGGIKRHATRR
jgi:hypothetical protein